MVAVAEDGVEPGQVARVPSDHPVAPFEAGPQLARADRRIRRAGVVGRRDGRGSLSRDVDGRIGGWPRHG
jgi:hypothetical protein